MVAPARRHSSWADEASAFFGVTLHRHSHDEYAGPCPVCGGKDRFIVFKTGNGWCRRCKHKQWWDKPEDILAAVAEETMNRRIQAVEARAAMAECEDWRLYHEDPGVDWVDQWRPRLGTVQSVMSWSLGFCVSCPQAPGTPSLTIPVWHHGVLVDIRHRLLQTTDDSGKYRSHRPGLIPAPFNADAIAAYPTITIIEGEVKTINLVDGGYPNTVGLPGLQVVDDLIQTIEYEGVTREAVLMFDPGADEEAETLATRLLGLGLIVRIADAFEKPDDILLQYGKAVLDEVIAQARTRR